MKMLMRSAGQIQSAFNGQEALDALGRDHPDFIIMDLRMPFVDGFEAIRRIKQNPETKDIPILGVSAQAMAEDKDNCLQAGADGYIAKPIEYETLRREVRNILP
jgi:CheY-like chemotaxis protein